MIGGNIGSIYLYFITTVQIALSYIIFLAAWFAGVFKIFAWTWNKMSFLPELVKDFLAIFLAVASAILATISWPVWVVDVFRRFIAHIREKSAEYANESDGNNIPLWYKVLKNEHTGLVLAYVVIPLHILLSLSGFGLLNSTTWPIVITNMLFVYVPPTIIRFVVKPQGLNSLLEILACMLISILCSFVFFYAFRSLIYFPTDLDELFICLVLSYKSEKKDNGSKLIRYSMFGLLVTVTFIRHVIRHGNSTPGATLISSVIASLMVLSFIFYFVSSKSNGQEDTITQNEGLKPPKLTPPAHQPTPPDKPAQLTATALALIGRPTLHENEYLTPAMTQSRHEAERPFVKILSATYRTDTERKAMSRHFMLWKEFAVFVALSQVLKSDKALLAYTQIMLKKRLNEGLPPDILKKRVERMRTMSVTFTAEYKISGSLEQSFLRTFRETQPEGLPKLPDSESVGGYLHGIYRFIYGGLKREYQGLRERERV